MSSDFALYKKENGEADFIRSVWSGAHVPDDWSAVNIGQSTDIVGGKAFSSDNFSKDTERGIPLVKRKTVNNDQMPEEHLHTEFDNRYKVTKGDLLISMDRYFECMIWPYREAALNQRVCRVEPNDMINTRYLGYALQKPLKYLEELGGTTDFTSLSMSEFDFIELPIPPADEQVRIASVLYSVDEQLKMLHDRHDSLTQLKHGLMQDLLTGNTRVTPEMNVNEEVESNPTDITENASRGEPVELDFDVGKHRDGKVGYARPVWSGSKLPQGWSGKTVSENAKIQGGKAFSGDRFSENYEQDGTPLIKRATVNNNRYPEQFLKGEFDDKYEVEYGDILVSMDGHFKSMLWIYDNAALNQRVCNVSPNRDVFNNWFLSYALKRPLKYTEDSTGATTVKSLSMKDFDYIEIPTPPLWEQERIASILYTVDEMIERTSELIDEYEHAKRGLMQDLLSGDVRTPEDLTALYTLRTDTDSMGAVDGGVTQTTLDI